MTLRSRILILTGVLLLITVAVAVIVLTQVLNHSVVPPTVQS